MKDINEDLIGYLSFDNGLISTPVVKGVDNDEYLRKSFEGKYSSQGVPFMNSTSELNDVNIILFGHNVYYDQNAMFSKLTTLKDQKTYDANKYFSFCTETEKRDYVITNVFYYTEEEMQEHDYLQTEFRDEGEFNSWISFANTRNLIDNGADFIQYGDNIMTLQTCKNWNDTTVILVLAKEVQRSGY